jgi:hypothetical protein
MEKDFLFEEFLLLVKTKKSVKTCLNTLKISIITYNYLKDKLNNPETNWICSYCKIEQPNSNYVKDSSKNKHRKYVGQCKSCRKNYINKFKLTESFKECVKKGRKKNRFTIIYNSSKGNALKRNIEHSISKEYIKHLYDIQKGLCYYTNKKMYTDLTIINTNEDSVSIDRIDSSKGYIEGNVVLCRWIINKVKNDLSTDKLFEVVKEIYKFNKL